MRVSRVVEFELARSSRRKFRSPRRMKVLESWMRNERKYAMVLARLVSGLAGL